MADVLRAEIDLTVVPAGTIRELLRRCLDRNLKSRLRDIGEARIAIENYSPGASAAVAIGTPWPWAVAVVSVLLAAGIGMAWLGKSPQAESTVTLELNPPDGTKFAGFALAPNGKSIAFAAISENGGRKLYIRQLESLTARPVPE